MSCVLIRCLLIFTFSSTFVYIGAGANFLSDKDVTKQVIHRLDGLERQVKQQHVEIETLGRENVNLKNLRKQDSEILSEQIVRYGRLRDEYDQLETEIDRLKERHTRLVARINLLENRDKDIGENVYRQPLIYHETDTIESNVESDAEKDVKDVKTDNDITTDDNGGIVSEYKGKPFYNRIRRHHVQGQTIAFFATRGSSHADHLGQHQNVVFDKTFTNIGQGYHNATGLFTAPVSGVYVFSTTLLTVHEGAHFEIVINGKAYTTMYSHSTEVYETLSQTVIFNLVKGDDVSIQSRDLDKMVHGNGHSTFSGFLLVPIDDNAFVG